MNIDEKLKEIDVRLSDIDSEISRLSSLKRKLTQAKEKLKDEKYLKKQNELEDKDWSEGENRGGVKGPINRIDSFRNLPVVQECQRKVENNFQSRHIPKSTAGNNQCDDE